MTINIRMAAAILCMLCASVVAHSQPAQTTTDSLPTDAAGRPMLLGRQPREALLRAPFADWFLANYQAYVVDSFTCQFIRPLLADKQLTIFMGTWCGDSRREVPRLLKMLDCCGFAARQLTLIMVSNHASMYKQSPGHEEAGRNVLRVPTLIVEANGKEVGRLIEYPVVSLEKDLLAILRHDGYVPHYSGSTGR
ncbi:MAG: thioredoxin family protein [Chitinophagaceae bacterium]|nr:thioredoxin family protein [Chitinophagaceae bacterium]